MKRVAGLIALLLIATPAYADNANPIEKGGGFLARCADLRDVAWVGPCTGYVAGLHDAVMTMRALDILPRCPAHIAPSYGTIKVQLLDYLRTHPEAAEEDTIFSMVNAMQITAPCGAVGAFARPPAQIKF